MADLAQHVIRPDATTFHVGSGGGGNGRLRQEPAGFSPGVQKRFHLTLQVPIATARLAQECGALLGRTIERRLEDILDALPAAGVGHRRTFSEELAARVQGSLVAGVKLSRFGRRLESGREKQPTQVV
jgi:hypothetical protein